VSELLPHELGVPLVIGAVEEDDVKMRIQAHVGRRSLDDRDSACLRAARSTGRRARGVERVHGVDEDAAQRRQQRAPAG
jgi:hypothetical protein